MAAVSPELPTIQLTVVSPELLFYRLAGLKKQSRANTVFSRAETNKDDLKEKRNILRGESPSFDIYISVRPVQLQSDKPGLLVILLESRFC